MKGPFDIEEVVDPIGVKISDAIMNFQRSGYEVSERVKQECGTPRIQKREVIFFACFHNFGKGKLPVNSSGKMHRLLAHADTN